MSVLYHFETCVFNSKIKVIQESQQSPFRQRSTIFFVGVSILFQIYPPPPKDCQNIIWLSKENDNFHTKMHAVKIFKLSIHIKEMQHGRLQHLCSVWQSRKNLYYLLNMDYSDFSLSSEKLRRDILTRLMKTDDVSNGV